MKVSLFKLIGKNDFIYYLNLPQLNLIFDRVFFQLSNSLTDKQKELFTTLFQPYLINFSPDYIFEESQTDFYFYVQENESILLDNFSDFIHNLEKGINYYLPVYLKSSFYNAKYFDKRIFSKQSKTEKVLFKANFLILDDDYSYFDLKVFARKNKLPKKLAPKEVELNNIILKALLGDYTSSFLKLKSFYKLDQSKSVLINLFLLRKIISKKNVLIPNKNDFLINILNKPNNLNIFSYNFDNLSEFEKSLNFNLISRVLIFLLSSEVDPFLAINYFRKFYDYISFGDLVIDLFFETYDKYKQKNKVNSKVSVIIPTKNNLSFLKKMLFSLLLYNETELEIIIVEDSTSNNESKEFYKQYSFFKLLINQKNLGFVKSVNEGYKLVESNYFLIANDDVMFAYKSIDYMYDLLIQNNDLGAIGSYNQDIFEDFLNEINQSSQIPYDIYKSNKNYIPNYYDFVSFNFSKINQVASKFIDNHFYFTNSITCHCLLMIKELSDTLLINGGLLDEAYGFGYIDDIDLCERIKRANYKLAVCQKSIVFHYGSISVKKSGIDREALTQQNIKIFLKKWFPNYIKSTENDKN